MRFSAGCDPQPLLGMMDNPQAAPGDGVSLLGLPHYNLNSFSLVWKYLIYIYTVTVYIYIIPRNPPRITGMEDFLIEIAWKATERIDLFDSKRSTALLPHTTKQCLEVQPGILT